MGQKLKGPLERSLKLLPDPNSPVYSILEWQRELVSLVKENIEQAQRKQKRYNNQRHQPTQFQVGDIAWVRTHPLSKADDGFMAKLSPKWKGPGKIVKNLGPFNYESLPYIRFRYSWQILCSEP